MATIKIKNSVINDEPVDLVEGELAYSETSGKLFIGARDGAIYTIGGQTDHDKLNALLPGGTFVYWQQATEPPLTGSPSATEGDFWYNTFTGEFSTLRGITWERLPYVREMDGDFGAVTMNGGYF